MGDRAHLLFVQHEHAMPRKTALCPNSRYTNLLLVLSVLAILGLPRELLACSVCGCDPAASTVGLDRPTTSPARLSIEDRFGAKQSGAGDARESEREDRLTFRAQFPIARRFVLEGTLPIYLLKQHLNAAGEVDDTARGAGDAMAGARWEFFRDNALAPRHVLALVAQVKFATGANDRLPFPAPNPARSGLHKDEPDFGYDEHLQLGSGSTDGLASLWYNASLRETTTLYASAGGRINGTNWRGFRYGHVFLAEAGVRERFLESGKLAFSLELDARNAGHDVYGDGFRDPDSGGFLMYATFGAFYAIGDDWFVRAQLQAPVVHALHGAQTEYPVGFLGVAWDVPR
jgi:hypothetical protein